MAGSHPAQLPSRHNVLIMYHVTDRVRQILVNNPLTKTPLEFCHKVWQSRMIMAPDGEKFDNIICHFDNARKYDR